MSRPGARANGRAYTQANLAPHAPKSQTRRKLPMVGHLVPGAGPKAGDGEPGSLPECAHWAECLGAHAKAYTSSTDGHCADNCRWHEPAPRGVGAAAYTSLQGEARGWW